MRIHDQTKHTQNCTGKKAIINKKKQKTKRASQANCLQTAAVLSDNNEQKRKRKKNRKKAIQISKWLLDESEYKVLR